MLSITKIYFINKQFKFLIFLMKYTFVPVFEALEEPVGVFHSPLVERMVVVEQMEFPIQ